MRARLQRSPGAASPAQVAGRSGSQELQALLAGQIPPPPMAVALGFTLLRIGRGFAVFQGQPRFRHYKPIGTVHSGWLATILETAMGYAVQPTLPAGKTYTTLELRLDPVRTLTDAVPLVQKSFDCCTCR